MNKKKIRELEETLNSIIVIYRRIEKIDRKIEEIKMLKQEKSIAS